MSLRKHLALAASAGLALRLSLVWKFPAVAGDTRIYEELAHNWLYKGVYGLLLDGRLTPVDIRVPGYPAFLAAVYAVLSESRLAVMLVQALVDLAGCFLTAGLAAAAAPSGGRGRVAVTALWLAATCPFVANYAAVPLAEVPATFLTALALLLIVTGLTREEAIPAEPRQRPSTWIWLLGGVVTGLATLVRPESPLLLVAVALVLVARWWRPHNWGKLARACALLAAGLFLALLPWAARNWLTLHRVQFLAPRYANLPGEFVPRGVYAWTRTWLVRFRDVYRVPWKLEDRPIPIEDLPASAFDSEEERARVAALLAQYNAELDLTPEIDSGFAQVARERTARHPLRTYAWIPIERTAVLWFTPRVELLPYSGDLWPVARRWREDPVDFSVTIFLALLSFFYAALALGGAWRSRMHAGVGILAAFILVRTIYFSQIETVEPRYVLVCFPAVLALAALAWPAQQSPLNVTDS